MDVGEDDKSAEEERWVREVTQQQILECFRAFNVNSFNSLAYVVTTNLWMILTIVGSLAIVVMNVKEEIEDYVTEEQNII